MNKRQRHNLDFGCAEDNDESADSDSDSDYVAQFLADPSMHFQKGRVYVWSPPPGSGGKSLVFGLSISTEISHEDYGDLGDPAVFVVYLRMDEHDPAFQAVEWHPEQCVCRRFLHRFFVTM
jgi:hypothetical protein